MSQKAPLNGAVEEATWRNSLSDFVGDICCFMVERWCGGTKRTSISRLKQLGNCSCVWKASWGWRMGAVKTRWGGEWREEQANGGKRSSSKRGVLGSMAIESWSRGRGWKHWGWRTCCSRRWQLGCSREKPTIADPERDVWAVTVPGSGNEESAKSGLVLLHGKRQSRMDQGHFCGCRFPNSWDGC